MRSGKRRRARFCVAGLALAGSALGLGLDQRFGPDGIPFTFDDPLSVAGFASPVRFGAVGSDACSEERGLANGRSAHGHQDGHPRGIALADGLAAGGDHRAAETPAQALAGLAPGTVLKAPFDMTVFALAIDLDDGSVRRHRILPEDSRWSGAETEQKHPDRGWVTGWTAAEEGPANGMGQVWQGGTRARDLHLATLGMGYRDAQAETGFGFGIWWETLGMFRFPHKEKFRRLDTLAQQVYLESTVVELTNLETMESAISGNHVVDVAGVRLVGLQSWREGPEGLCVAALENFPLSTGGPISERPGLALPDSLSLADYHLTWKIPYPDPEVQGKTPFDTLWEKVRLQGLCELAPAMVKPFAEAAARGQYEAMDKVAALIGPDDYRKISLYSGLAGGEGGEGKNPFDRIALGTLEKGGQFQPTSWLAWKRAGMGSLAGMMLDPEGADRVAASLGTLESNATALPRVRYNSGSTFLAKTAMMFGNSAGEDRTENPFDVLAPDPRRPLPELVPVLAEQSELRRTAPDVLESLAKRWTYVRLDAVDPHALAVTEGVALWSSTDALFPSGGGGRPPVRVEWPPPNFHFGRGQIEAFRTGSGGEPLAGDGAKPGTGGRVPDVDIGSALVWQGLVCIDPVAGTYSVSAVGFRQGGASPGVVRVPGEVAVGADLGWTLPRPLAELPAEFVPASRRRWLSAAANRHLGAAAELAWAWDFERDGTVDSRHAQHLSEVGEAAVGGVFAVETAAAGGAVGATGFRFVAMDEEAR